MIDAYAARPLGNGAYSGVPACHRILGWDTWPRDVVRKTAWCGYNVISFNPDMRFDGAPPQERSSAVRASGGQVNAQVLEHGGIAIAGYAIARRPTERSG